MTLKPPPLREGDTIAVVAPASVPRDMSKFKQGVEQLRVRGYRVEVGRAEYVRRGYLCGPDPDRLNELNGYLRRPDVKLILSARGGYGTMRLLPELDYEAIKQHPKLLVGYSDITALHFAIFEKTGVPGISGPMAAVEWHDPDPASERLFWDLVRGGTPESVLGPKGEQMQGVRPGTVQGVLLGGNLSVIVRLIGTPYLPSLDGAILYVEDVGEQPYRIDRMWTHLRLAGVFDRLAGVALGDFTDCETPGADFTLRDIIAGLAGETGLPCVGGFPIGHGAVNVPVALGARVRLDGGAGTLTFLEPAVAD